MSIDDSIRLLVDDGRLVLLEPLLKGEHTRVVFLDAATHEDMTRQSTSRDAYRIGLLVRDLNRFSSGRLISFGYREEKECFMKHLSPLADEIWEIRSRDPSPGYRIFCSFAAPDVLIVLTYGRRIDLGKVDSPAWSAAVRECKAKWRRLFFPYTPYSGQVASDYIQRNVIISGDIP